MLLLMLAIVGLLFASGGVQALGPVAGPCHFSSHRSGSSTVEQCPSMKPTLIAMLWRATHTRVQLLPMFMPGPPAGRYRLAGGPSLVRVGSLGHAVGQAPS